MSNNLTHAQDALGRPRVDAAAPLARSAVAIAVTAVVAHLACITQYGVFRDELYYLACSEHLDWGYVDQPPLIALIVFAVRKTLGDSLVALRLLPALSHGALVLLTADIARRMGGRRSAQTLAALCITIAPIYLGIMHFMSMNAFEPLVWMGCIDLALAIVGGASPSLWLLFGALAGIGLENKHTTLFFGSAFFAALLLSEQRRMLRQMWIWAGGLIAALVFLPNLIWEVRHDFATVELLSNIAHSNKNTPVTPWSFLAGQIVLMNPMAAPVWIIGLVWLLRHPRYRFAGLCWIVITIEFIVMKGKIYYLSPAFPMLLAAGGIALERMRFAAARNTYVALLVIAGIAFAPMTLPVLPPPLFIAYQKALHLAPPETENHDMGPLPQQYADMFGWPEMAATVARVYNTLTPAEKAKCAIFGQNYGEAGAIDFFGRRHGLPKAISAHQNYFYWGPRGYSGDVMIVIDDNRESLDELFQDVRAAAVIHHPYAMPYENENTVWLCRGMKTSLTALWPKIKNWR